VRVYINGLIKSAEISKGKTVQEIAKGSNDRTAKETQIKPFDYKQTGWI
jgi:hypothetical protein